MRKSKMFKILMLLVICVVAVSGCNKRKKVTESHPMGQIGG